MKTNIVRLLSENAKLKRERDEDQAQRLRVQLNHFWQANEMAEQAFRERDEARELHKKSLREREAAERESDATLERAHRAERERDEARERLHPDRAMQWLSAYYQAWFGDRSKWADDIADRFYKDTATLTLFCQDFTFPKEASK